MSTRDAGGRAGIEVKRFEEASEAIAFEHGRAAIVSLGGQEVWRSDLEPGWSWDSDLAPLAGGAKSCPLTHREYVVSGRIRYVMDDGTETEATGGDALFIPPGHRAFVVGEETCILIDW